MKSITAKINGEVRTLSEWADLYGLSRWTIWQRLHAGCIEDELIAPLPSDTLDEFYVHKLWGSKWVWRKKQKKDAVTKKYFRKNERWVYIGKPEKMSIL